MKPFELTIAVRNNLLKERRMALGLSQTALAQSAGVCLDAYNGLESMRAKPIRFVNVCSDPGCERKIMIARGHLCPDHRSMYGKSEPPRKLAWKNIALKLAEHYGCEPQDLFPDEILNVGNPKAIIKLDIVQISQMGMLWDAEAADVPRLAQSAEEEFIKQEEIQQLDGLLAALPQLHRVILKLHLGIGCQARTLDDIGRNMGRTRSRIGQLEAEAISRLRKLYAKARRQIPETKQQKENIMGQPQGIEYETVTETVPDATPPMASVPTAPDQQPAMSDTYRDTGAPSAEADKSAI